ncbi:phosphatidylserine decarboxylase family protein [Kitasatospora aureofaciens]|uniref:phosphatidylserine decarboxylase family protein n=1 Tax=Kitasatospora aureofaciens TaxID=1894 RepID=UPI00380C9A78
MNPDLEKDIEERYRNSFGVVAGYLPENRAALDEWQLGLMQQVADEREKGTELRLSVKNLQDLIDSDGIVRMYVTEMIDQVRPEHKKGIHTIPDLLQALNVITKTAPEYRRNPRDRNFFPMSSLFVYMMMTPAGEAAFRNEDFNDAIRDILKDWCDFLDRPESRTVLTEDENGWLSQAAREQNKLYEFVTDPDEPYWGFRSYNDYFHRQIKDEFRPVAGLGDPKVVVSANDGTLVRYVRGVKRSDNFWIKGQPYSLVNMLDSDDYTDRFIGGDVFQSFLSGADYHRWRAPIDGIVRMPRVVEGLMFSNAETAGWDTTAGTKSQCYQASVNTRGLVFIESKDPKMGMVCVIPIGITEISSITISVKDGQPVEKGQELGYFSYGGSSMCLVFQPGAIDHFTVPQNTGGDDNAGAPIFVNSQIALAR